jgi:uridine kinase
MSAYFDFMETVGLRLANQSQPLLIGVSGVARSGKDTFARALERDIKFTNPGVTTIRVS